MGLIAVTWLAAQVAAETPEVLGTSVTVLFHHVGTAGAMACSLIAMADAFGAVGGQSAYFVTSAAWEKNARISIGKATTSLPA